MTDYQQLVDDIRGFLAGGRQRHVEEMTEWAIQYANACREVNVRLRQCRDYLQDGFRSEAVHLANKHPPILDVVTALDFPELDQWRELCAERGAVQPPAVAADLAQALNDAYTEEMPLKGLLTTHRVLNLAQAPLPARISVVRQIAAADDTSAHWMDDLEALEQARLTEIAGVAHAAAKARDREQLVAIRDEIEAPVWRVPIPRQLKTGVASHLRALELEGAEALIVSLLPQLEAAQLAMDYEQASLLLKQIDRATKGQRVHLAGPTKDRIDGVRAWVTERNSRLETKRAFEDACAALQQGIDKGAATPELARLYRHTASFSEELPEQLERQYHQGMYDRSQRGRRRMIVVVSSMSAVVIIAVTLGGLWFYQSSYHATAQRWADIAHEATQGVESKGDLVRAQSIRQTIATEGQRFLGAPEVARSLLALDQSIKTEQQRLAAFASQLKTASQASLDAPEEKALASAKALAKQQDERDAVQDLENRINEHRAKTASDAEAAFEAKVRNAQREIEVRLTSDRLATQKSQYIQELASLNAEVRELGNDRTVRPEFRDSVLRGVNVLLEQRKDLVGKGEAEVMLVESIIADGPSCDALGRDLRAYCDQFPSGPKAADFQKALLRLDAEKPLVAWNVLAGLMETAPRTKIEATGRVEQLQTYLKNYPRSPIADAVVAYRDLLKKGLDAASDDGPILKTLKPLFSGPLLTELYVVTTNDGKRVYYTPQQPSFREDSIGKSFQAYLSPNLSQVSQVHLDKSVTTSLDNGGLPSESPQMSVSKAIEDRINHLNYPDWATVSLSAADTILKSKDLHPVVKGILLQRVLATHDEMLGWASGDVFNRTEARLTQLTLGNVAWMDPKAPPPEHVVSDVASIVSECPKVDGIQAVINRKIAGISRITNFGSASVGLFVGRLGQPATIQTVGHTAEGSRAEVLPPNGEVRVDETGLKMTCIAVMEGNRWHFDKAALVDIPEGSIVFICKPH